MGCVLSGEIGVSSAYSQGVLNEKEFLCHLYPRGGPEVRVFTDACREACMRVCPD